MKGTSPFCLVGTFVDGLGITADGKGTKPCARFQFTLAVAILLHSTWLVTPSPALCSIPMIHLLPVFPRKLQQLKAGTMGAFSLLSLALSPASVQRSHQVM
jgi:hypothetical protein